MDASKNQILKALTILNRELAKVNEVRELIACGGGALSIMGVTSRETRDLDVIIPALDEVLLKCSHAVAREMGLDEEWLNNGPRGFVKDLDKGFELRTDIIFKGSNLTIRALGRRDLIATKLQGLCDRDEVDLLDLLMMNPTIQEIESLRPWLLLRDANPNWEKRVESKLKQLFDRMSYEK